MTVEIVPYDETWPQLFATTAAPMRASLGNVALRIDHIGSTAVPGLPAKPVLDVQVSVASFDPLDAFLAPLERVGYVFHGDDPELTKRFFREPPATRRTHVHVRLAGSFDEQFALLFRDYVRNEPAIAAEYAELKRRLAELHGDDRAGYTDAKSPFIWDVIRRADEWAQTTGWQPGPSDA
jgi:GrpB-like predicted nucleotidyltransferase (UPF0157 family)